MARRRDDYGARVGQGFRPDVKVAHRTQGGKEGVGRGDWIRTSDTCVPNAVLYQAELHPESREGDGGADGSVVALHREGRQV